MQTGDCGTLFHCLSLCSIVIILLDKQIGERGLSSLHLDPVYQKNSASDSCLTGLICTSCKANEEAVAKCMDCDNLLCPNCYSAHKVNNISVVLFNCKVGSNSLLHQLISVHALLRQSFSYHIWRVESIRSICAYKEESKLPQTSHRKFQVLLQYLPGN